jgi:hypothetical protein
MSKKLAAKASLIQPCRLLGPAAGNGSSGTAHSPHTASKRPLAGADATRCCRSRRVRELRGERAQATRG